MPKGSEFLVPSLGPLPEEVQWDLTDPLEIECALDWAIYNIGWQSAGSSYSTGV